MQSMADIGHSRAGHAKEHECGAHIVTRGRAGEDSTWEHLRSSLCSTEFLAVTEVYPKRVPLLLKF